MHVPCRSVCMGITLSCNGRGGVYVILLTILSFGFTLPVFKHATSIIFKNNHYTEPPPPPRAYQRVWLFLLEIFGPRSCALGRPFLTARPRTFQK